MSAGGGSGRVTTSRPAWKSETKFGLNAGAGFDFKAGSVGLFIEGRFHNVFTDESDAQFIPITVGVRFGGR